MSTITLELRDADVRFIDDISPNIIIDRSLIPFDDIQIDDYVDIFYEEDAEDNIKHRYTITSITPEEVKLAWMEQLTEGVLQEKGFVQNLKDKLMPSEADKLQKNIAKVDKQEEKSKDKLRKQAQKLLARDMSSDGRDWKFYFPNSNGSFNKPVDQAAARQLYTNIKGDNIPDEVLNAIVVSPQANMIMRRGMEDTSKELVTIAPEHMKLDPRYAVGDNIPTKAAIRATSTKKQSGAPAESNAAAETADAQESATKYSDTLLKKAAAIINVTGVEVLDAEDKPIKFDMNTELTPEFINSSKLKIRTINNPIPMSMWLDNVTKNKIITEDCDVETTAKDKRLMEAPVITFNDAERMNPDRVSVRDMVTRATKEEEDRVVNAERAKREAALKEKAEGLFKKFETARSTNDREHIIDTYFEGLVPSSGAAESVAGEYIRAIVRILYRDSNDGDKFFSGYGIDTCGSSAEYLYDNGFHEQIAHMMDMAYQLGDDDDKYTEELYKLAQQIIDTIVEHPELMWTINETDSRDYSVEYIVENQPRYELDIYGSDDIVALVENDVLTAWDLVHYVESQLKYDSELRDAEVGRPWTHSSTEVTLENLTRDGYDMLHDRFTRDPDGFWEDLVAEHADELPNDEEDDEDYDDDYTD